MAARPEISGTPNYFPWATQDLQQVISKDGNTLILDNKKAPTGEFLTFGLKRGQPLNYPEVNSQFAGYSNWFQHLDERYAIGDTHLTTSSETEGQISVRLGGTWELLATDTVGLESIKIYVKTA